MQDKDIWIIRLFFGGLVALLQTLAPHPQVDPPKSTEVETHIHLQEWIYPQPNR
jgi:hypothetical protein